MTRTIVNGWYYDPVAEPEARFKRGWALLDGARLVETGKASSSPPKGKAIKGIALPALPNAHTHLGDFNLRSKVKPGMSVEELVAPPDGLKHRLLPKIDVTDSIGQALTAMGRAGIGQFCDFREGGSSGVEAMARALVSYGKGMRAIILGRPKKLDYDRKEIDAILSKCKGIGVSAVRDWDQSALSLLSTHVRGKGKVLALHASETVREDLDQVLDLNPDFVIHMVKGTTSDFHRLSVLGIPVVVCPRVNAFFGSKPPLRAMLDANVMVCVGTDNAMLNDMSILDELRTARTMGLSALEAWGLIESSWKLLNRMDIMHHEDPYTRWMMIETVTDEPFETLTGAGPHLKFRGN